MPRKKNKPSRRQRKLAQLYYAQCESARDVLKAALQEMHNPQTPEILRDLFSMFESNEIRSYPPVGLTVVKGRIYES